MNACPHCGGTAAHPRLMGGILGAGSYRCDHEFHKVAKTTCNCGHPMSLCSPERCHLPYAHNALGLGDEP